MHGTGSQALEREECLALLPTAPYGRVVSTRGALPLVLPATFVLDGDGVVLAPGEQGSAELVGAAVVAFHVDRIDAVQGSGWTVTVVGRTAPVRDRSELSRLAELLAVPPRPGGLVAVELGIVSGRRLAEPVLQARSA